MIADGLSNKQIAARLNLSLHTVKNHVHNLLEKLAVEGRYAAVQYACERRWLVAATAAAMGPACLVPTVFVRSAPSAPRSA